MTFDFTKIHLRHGSGKGDPQDGLCLMQMVDWFNGHDKKLSDHPSCACPILTRFGMCLNDSAPSQAARDTLWPLVFQLISSHDPSMEKTRLEFLILEITKGPVAQAFEIIGEPDHATALRSVKTLGDVKKAARKAKPAAYANAAAVAAYGNAAAAAATAAAYAAYAAAAGNAANAAAYGNAKLKCWTEARNIFERAIALGKHGECDPVGQAPRLEQIKRILVPAA